MAGTPTPRCRLDELDHCRVVVSGHPLTRHDRTSRGMNYETLADTRFMEERLNCDLVVGLAGIEPATSALSVLPTAT